MIPRYRSMQDEPCREPLLWCLVMLPSWVVPVGIMCPTCRAVVRRPAAEVKT